MGILEVDLGGFAYSMFFEPTPDEPEKDMRCEFDIPVDKIK